jgi:hypothetical protein
MNERIKELSNIAYKNHLARNPHSSFGRRYDYDKEFAELIVKECQTVVEWAISVDSTIDRVPVLIKEHFGVEE